MEQKIMSLTIVLTCLFYFIGLILGSLLIKIIYDWKKHRNKKLLFMSILFFLQSFIIALYGKIYLTNQIIIPLFSPCLLVYVIGRWMLVTLLGINRR